MELEKKELLLGIVLKRVDELEDRAAVELTIDSVLLELASGVIEAIGEDSEENNIGVDDIRVDGIGVDSIGVDSIGVGDVGVGNTTVDDTGVDVISLDDAGMEGDGIKDATVLDDEPVVIVIWVDIATAFVAKLVALPLSVLPIMTSEDVVEVSENETITALLLRGSLVELTTEVLLISKVGVADEVTMAMDETMSLLESILDARDPKTVDGKAVLANRLVTRAVAMLLVLAVDAAEFDGGLVVLIGVVLGTSEELDNEDKSGLVVDRMIAELDKAMISETLMETLELLLDVMLFVITNVVVELAEEGSRVSDSVVESSSVEEIGVEEGSVDEIAVLDIEGVLSGLIDEVIVISVD